jgi:hypothetical protein
MESPLVLPIARSGVRCLGVAAIVILSHGVAIADMAGHEGVGWFPTSLIYGTYLADLRSAESMLGFASVPTVDIDGADEPRYWLKAGGTFGIYRSRNGPLDWQIDVPAAVISAQFDLDNEQDKIGWDGLLGLFGTFKREKTGLRAGYLHDSSHIGDELIENTGRTRIEYTRDEVLVGVTRIVAERFRLYGESGYATHMGAAAQKRWRFQGGAEWEGPRTAFRGNGSWYGALNLASYQEKDYQIDLSLQGGVAFRSDGRRWRLAMTLYKGTVPIGEFFEDDETYVMAAVHLNP